MSIPAEDSHGGAEHLALPPGLPAGGALRVAVLGIGNELNGDDAAGVLAARRLLEALVDQPGAENRYIVEAGPSPESFTGPLRRFAPHVVALVDAAEMGLPPGSARWFDWPAAEGLSASTHTLPPSMLARFLTAELGCHVILAGIQPKHLNFDQPVSEEVQQAASDVAAELLLFLQAD